MKAVCGGREVLLSSSDGIATWDLTWKMRLKKTGKMFQPLRIPVPHRILGWWYSFVFIFLLDQKKIIIG